MNSVSPITTLARPTPLGGDQSLSNLTPGCGPLGRYHLKRPESYSSEQLHLLASLYYSHGWQQGALAELFKFSQAKVSRMLTVARERGIARYWVEPYEPRDAELERRLTKKFELSAVAVIMTPPGAAPADKRQFVAHFGSSFISSLISPRSDVVVAGGRTIAELVNRIPEDPSRHVTVLQALGIVDSNLEHVDALELGQTLARRWGGCFMNINMPAIAPDKRTRDSLLRLNNAQSVWKRLGHADAAIVAVGTPTNSVFANRYVVTTNDLEALMASGAVGEICGRFFDGRGHECNSPWRDQVISVELDHLRNLPQVVALVVGKDRSAAVAAAIRGGLLKSLVIDKEGALALLEI